MVTVINEKVNKFVGDRSVNMCANPLHSRLWVGWTHARTYVRTHTRALEYKRFIHEDERRGAF